MTSIGIIVEYNPFHNGHLYQLNKIKEKYPDSIIIVVMSGNFTERGEPSLIDKFKKVEIAKKAGVDLIVELPYAYATESADTFSYAGVTILENLKVNKLVFGSETNNINTINTLVATELDNKEFDPLVRLYMKMGNNYPTSMSMALTDLTGKTLNLPNDLLGISYVKTIKKYHYNIIPECFKRTTAYNDNKLNNNISSALAIREALLNKEDISKQVPSYVLDYLNDFHFPEDYFKYLKYKIMLDDNLENYQTIDHPLALKIKKYIIESTSLEELINNVKTKHYTRNRITRALNHILCNYTKDLKEACELDYIRVLGFNEKGRKYLNSIKKEVKIPIYTTFSKIKSQTANLEYLATCTYASTLREETKKNLINKEYQTHP
jgi:predicted nucleotidyltransferase